MSAPTPSMSAPAPRISVGGASGGSGPIPNYVGPGVKAAVRSEGM
jgi:hypothetical protein